MLQLDGAQSKAVGVRNRSISMWSDDQVPNKFYVLPAVPTIRVDNNKPVFKFMKYRSAIDRPDGPRGGLAVFDVELAVYSDEREALKQLLLAQINANPPQNRPPYTDIEFGAIPFTEGTVTLNISDLSGNLVERVISSGVPSLFGNNVATFTAELSPEGATLFEKGLSGDQDGGGLIAVEYHLFFSAMLPPVEVKITFDAQKMKTYYENQGPSRGWGTEQKQTIEENFTQSGSGQIDINFANANLTEDQKKELRDWAQKTLEDMVARQLDPKLDEVGNRNKIGSASFLQGKTYEDSLKALTSFSQTFKERSAINYQLRPQATLPNITAMIDDKGARLVSAADLKNYFSTVDLDDDFFKRVRITVVPNTDFDLLRLNDLQVKLRYADVAPKELVFTKSNPNPQVFEAYLAADRTRQYRYSYQANFKMNDRGEMPTFQSAEFTSDDDNLTVSTNEIGVLLVRGYAKNMDWELMRRALVTLHYEDKAQGVPLIERQIELNQVQSEFSYSQPIGAKRGDTPFSYKVLYTFQDGDEYETPWMQQVAGEFYLNDPFNLRSYEFRSVGNFKDIDAIFLEAVYNEGGSALHLRKSLVFDSQHRKLEWQVPSFKLASDALNPGKVTYKGTIQYTNGNIEAIDETTTSEFSIQIGRVRQGVQEIEVSAEDLDFDNIYKRIDVDLRHGAKAKGSFSFREDNSEDWEFDKADVNDTRYEWRLKIQYDDDMRRKLLGTVYLPGPGEDVWGSAEANSGDGSQFRIAEYILDDETLAKQRNLFIVQISKAEIDWSAADKLEIEVFIKYGRGREVRVEPLVEGRNLRFFNEGHGDDDPPGLFLTEVERNDSAGPVASYQWRAVFRAEGEDPIYYPGLDKSGFAQESISKLYLCDYLPRKLGGKDESK